MMLEALLDLLAGGWLGLPFVLCVLAALPLGAGAWLARWTAGDGHWLPRSLALSSAAVVFLSLCIWLPMVTNALDAARLAFDDADVATRSAIFSRRYSVGVYGLALGLGVLVFGFGGVLLGAFGARQRGGQSAVLLAALCFALGIQGALALRPNVSALLRAFAAIAFAEPWQKDGLMRVATLELRDTLADGRTAVLFTALAAAAISVLFARKSAPSVPPSWMALCLVLLGGGSYAYASTRGLAHDAALDFPAHQPFEGRHAAASLPRVAACIAAKDDPVRQGSVLRATWQSGALSEPEAVLTAAENALKQGQKHATVVVLAEPGTRSDELAAQLSPLAAMPFESIALRAWVSAPRSLATGTAGTLNFEDSCTVPLPVPSEPQTVQALVNRTNTATPADWRAVLGAGMARHCEQLEAQANALLEPLSHCESDDDCKVVGLRGGCPDAFACSVFVNFVTDIRALQESASTMSSMHERAGCGCTRPVAECTDPGIPVCRDGRCARSR